MDIPQPFTLRSQLLGTLPVLNFFLTRMDLARRLESYLPADDARLRLAPAAAIGVLVRNIVADHRPVYAIGEWASGYEAGLLGLGAGQAAALNDDRLGRMLDRLFDADRASLITETVVSVIGEFDIQMSQLHNDSTTVTVSGAYPDADGHIRGGKKTAAIRHGHNKDFRPDLKQLLFVLSVCADGAVPIAYRVADGNTPSRSRPRSRSATSRPRSMTPVGATATNANAARPVCAPSWRTPLAAEMPCSCSSKTTHSSAGTTST